MKHALFALALLVTSAHAIDLEAAKRLCAAAIAPTLKDPPSLRIEGAHTGLQPGEVNLLVNAKNSYGGYTGAKAYTCQLSPDGKSVLSVRNWSK